MVRLLSALAVWLFLGAADMTKPASGSQAALGSAVTNSTHEGNATETGGKEQTGQTHEPMIQRSLYVLVGITMIGVLYFLIRAVRLEKPAHRKKYGLLSNYDDAMEMEAVESDEDDTLYEAHSRRR